MTIAVWARSNKKVKASVWSTKWVILNVLLILFFCFVYVWLSVQNIRLGYQIAEAMEVQKQLKEKNHVLKLEWTYLTSPTYLKTKAEKLGLKYPKEVIVLQR
ncbi:MAG TPA: hypothetical protein ENG63_02730 [Candidatus Desulfofervidus auxilii]|uniref:Cell division protein FtsL n=1 Tax=Desulfofervidus auxilii TaxID=1621989 RepID=A0A7C0Y3Z0_DESA2|nr:cell division protein FtsL [Candidatus Desulfofervidus auxilii]HDD43761.1 hypothetical protein [Candidatus Desulfofervidus auxilii]